MGRRPAVLVIAGSDSSGGAGIVRDLRVLADLEAHALCAITAVTAQTHGEVVGIHHIAPDLVRAQILTALETTSLGAIKIGMLGTAATVRAVADALPRNGSIPIVPEAASLCGASPAASPEALMAQARTLLSTGARSVLLKGGHGAGPQAVD